MKLGIFITTYVGACFTYFVISSLWNGHKIVNITKVHHKKIPFELEVEKPRREPRPSFIKLTRSTSHGDLMFFNTFHCVTRSRSKSDLIIKRTAHKS